MKSSWLASGLLVLAALSACGTQPGSAAGSSDTAGTAAPSPTCRIIEPASTTYRDAAGRTHNAPGPGRAKVERFSDAGTVWDEVTPPVDFRPTEATDAELAAFGFAPRPSSGAALQDWHATYANYRGVAAPEGPRCAPSADLQFAPSLLDD